MEQAARGAEGGVGDAAPPPDGGGRQVIRWDSILPRRSLRVLLVEHDDSTRHVVTALLRKCSYHVAAVADGIKAWEVLQERRYALDLVLTEVVMPSLSGIGLLTKIMATEECRNIPVIMMSSQDSIGVVLKCMLKGAADFLVKPVRKNELRNLWQHVWRRHCAISQENASDNNAASNHISANAGDRSKTGEPNDGESDAQSSGSKPEIEIESAQNFQGIAAAEVTSSSRKVEGKLQGPDSGIDLRENLSKMGNYERSRAENNVENKSPVDLNISGDDAQLVDTHGKDATAVVDSHQQNDSVKNILQSVEPIAVRKCSSSVVEKDDVGGNGPCEASTSSTMKSKSELGSSQLIDFTLRNGCLNQDFRENRVLNHSNASAFSRYCDKKVQYSGQKPLSSSLCISNRESVDNERDSSMIKSHETLLSQQGHAGETAEHFRVLHSDTARTDICANQSTTEKDNVFHPPQFGFISVPIPAGYVLQSIYYPQTSFLQHDLVAAGNTPPQITSNQHNFHDNPRDDSHNLKENHQTQSSGQFHGEPGESRDLSCTPTRQVNQSADADANAIAALESGNESGVQNCIRNGVNSELSRRQAALIKFRMKRKDRCFEKKVRYHSRQKLAEQRPRVKGQFVSQKAAKSMASAEAEE